jgi:hypothetical protein
MNNSLLNASIATSGTDIVTSNLQMYLDVGRQLSYFSTTAPNTGSIVRDLTSNANSGSFQNGPTYNSANGGVIVFDGSDDHLNCGQNLSLQFNRTSGYTLNAWVLTPTAPNFGSTYSLMWRGSGNYASYAVLITPSGFGTTNGIVFYTNGQNTFGGVSNIIAANTWYMVTVTHVGNAVNNARIYTNGVFRGSPNVNFDNPPTNTDVGLTQVGYFGRSFSFISSFAARMSQVHAYNRALSDSEILQNFNADRLRYGL